MKTHVWASALLLGGIAAAPAYARVHDHLFQGRFETPADAPASRAAAARFLTQATFGPTQADISRVMALGVREWIEEELAKPATLSRPYVEQVVAAKTAGAQGIGQSIRQHRWFWQATYAPDQLRQRMAYALSQIFVISDQGVLGGDIIPMADYYDLLARDGFGLYRALLGKITYHPSMGKYLSSFRNQKPGTTTQPDENYAREVMQLFSVGLILRNLNFTPMLDGSSNTQPTYDQGTITRTAKIFTGFTYSDAPTNPANFYGGALTNAGAYNPMACWGTELFASNLSNMRHDITGDDGTMNTPKTVIGGLTIPAGQTCAEDVADELDIIAGHNNVAPFISRLLIQRFVTSNPSPAYIQRVATKFENNGAGDRGDLGDVIIAILTDTEARNPPALAAGDSYGKLREPMLRLTALWRAWSAVAPAADIYGEVRMMGNTNFLDAYGQGPLQSPTVFNFYMPDFQPPGAFASANLYSPELQNISEATTYSTGRSYYEFTANAYIGMTTAPTDRPSINLSTLTANVNTPALMVDSINANMLYGTMSTNMRNSLTNMISFMSGASANEKAWSAIYVTMLSPEYAAQR